MFSENSCFVWSENYHFALAFSCEMPKGEYRLKHSGRFLFRVYVNDVIVSYGPARSGEGHLRVDDLDLSPHLSLERNEVLIHVVHYDIDTSFYILPGQACYRAEISAADGQLLYRTSTLEDEKAFRCSEIPGRTFCDEHYSLQRHFVEHYDYQPLDHNEIDLNQLSEKTLRLVRVMDGSVLMPRGVPFPCFNVLHQPQLRHSGSIGARLEEKKSWLREPGYLDRFKSLSWEKDEFGEEYFLYDFGKVVTGFIQTKITCSEDSEIVIAFEEIFPGSEEGKAFSFDRCVWCNNYIRVKCRAGQSIDFESFEVYTFRYLAFFVISGGASFKNTSCRDYAYDSRLLEQAPQLDKKTDPEIKGIYGAAIETYRQNTLDIYMDCPGRERGGWLCDSFYQARAEYFLTGNTTVEEAFIENFLCPQSYTPMKEKDGKPVFFPEGMIPMVYPGTIFQFIPLWPMWLVIQIDEYLNERNGQRNFFEEYSDKFIAFIGCLENYMNEEGCLEDIPGWNFVEWSKANEYVEGLNLPTNMAFARVLEILGGAYGRSEWTTAAQRIRRYLKTNGRRGDLYCDNAIRENGKLVFTENHSEVCQYFSYFFAFRDMKDPCEREVFKRIVAGSTSPKADPVNMFIGRMLKYELMLNSGMAQQVVGECREIFSPMLEQSGTIWENDTPHASLCHGFSSFVANILYRAQQE